MKHERQIVLLRQSFVLILALPAIAFAEVSDKIPSQTWLWSVGAILFVVFTLLIRLSRWFNIIPVLFVILVFESVWDTYVLREAILKEQGPIYFVAMTGFVTLIVAGIVLGNFLKK